MSEKPLNTSCDADMSNSSVVFDNLTILSELENIANLVREEDFLEAVPKAKLKRVKWSPMFTCLKQGILDDMVQELNSMWQFENIPQKLAVLEKQKEVAAGIDTPAWRPQLNDVTAQLKAQDVANLKNQKALLETLANEYDTKVNRLKKNISARRGYLKALQLDLQKKQKKNEEILTKLGEKIENHTTITRIVAPSEIDMENLKWNVQDYNMDMNDSL